jgi:preprotein translocase subunit SecD
MKRRLIVSLIFGSVVTIIYLCVYQYVIEKKKKNGEFESSEVLPPGKFNAQLLIAIDRAGNVKGPTADDLILIKRKLEEKAKLLDKNATVSSTENNDFRVNLPEVEDTAGLDIFFTGTHSVQFWETYRSGDLQEFINALQNIDKTIFEPLPIQYNDGKSELAPRAELAYLKQADTTAARKMLTDAQLKNLIPPDALFLFGISGDQKKIALYAIRTRGFNDALVTEKDVKDALLDRGYEQQVEVRIIFNKNGSKKWYMLTKANVNGYIAMAVNNFILSAPRVIAPIEGGVATLSGDFTVGQARNLAADLKTGQLPRPLKLMEKQIRAIKPPLFYQAKNVLLPLLVLILFTFLSYHLLALIKLPGNSTL